MTFTMNYLYVKGEESEQAADDSDKRFDHFSAGERFWENICGQCSQRQEGWALMEESIEATWAATAGNLLAYKVLYAPEDWLFYLGDAIFL